MNRYGTGLCGLCETPFRFDARRVPIVMALGRRLPICRPCMQAANQNRARRGLPLLPIPAGAYEPDPS